MRPGGVHLIPHLKGKPVKKVTVGRYGNVPADIPRPAHGIDIVQGQPVLTEDVYGGWIEGDRDDGTTWIMFLDNHGSPQCFWANRDETGAVIGDPIMLA